jgi:toxin CptA
MSIAVSAVVRPSRLLISTLGAACLVTVAVGLTVAFGALGELTPPVRACISTVCIFIGFFGFYHGIRYRKNIQLDISGAGQLRIADAYIAATCMSGKWPHVQTNGEVVRLLKNSTIWPNLLLLRLQHSNGKTITLPILPDCVSRDSFRALSVACRWIATHGNFQEAERS